jgi:hypothetical protein
LSYVFTENFVKRLGMVAVKRFQEPKDEFFLCTVSRPIFLVAQLFREILEAKCALAKGRRGNNVADLS